MTWAAAGWLAGVVPWVAVLLYVAATNRRAAPVPFLPLWRAAGAAGSVGVRRRPPAWVWVVMAAALLGIVAAAGPVGRGGGSTAVVVLGRGVGLAGADGGRPFRGTVDRAATQLCGAAARLVCVPAAGEPSNAVGDWPARAAGVPPTALDTGPAVDAAVADLARGAGRGPFLVLTDRPLATRDPRVVRVGPTGPRGGTGVVAVAARDRPRAQVMVRVVNRSAAVTVTVRVTSDGVTTVRPSAVAVGERADVFVDVPRLGRTVRAEVDPAAIDGVAFLAEGAGAGVTAAADAAEPVRRLVAVFDRSAGPVRSAVVAAGGPPAAGVAGVWVEDAGSGAADGPVVVRDHPVTAGVRGWAGGGAVPPAGFAAVVTRGGRAVVAVREGPRQVWADLDVGRASRSVDWVVFLANAFRWVGDGPAEWGSIPPGALGQDWTRVDGGAVPAGVGPGLWPGVYRSATGQVVAVNAVVPVGSAPDGGVAPVVTVGRAGGRPLGGSVAAAAVGCLAVAAGVGPAGRAARRPRVTAGSKLT